MKIEITNLKDLRECPHCFCISATVKTGAKQINGFESKDYAVLQDVNTDHLRCCNCSLLKRKE